jgi:ATP-dependent metalloprotease FtsH
MLLLLVQWTRRRQIRLHWMAAAARRRRRAGPGRPRFGLWASIAIAVLLAGYVGIVLYSRPHVSGEALRFDQLVRLVNEKRVRNVTILNEDAYVVGRYRAPDGTSVGFNAPYLRVGGSQESLITLLLRRNVPLRIDQQVGKGLLGAVSLLLPALIIVVIFIYLLLAYRSGSGLFGMSSGARRMKDSDPRMTFADVAGQDAAVAELRELATFLAEPERFASLGAQIPRGVLLYGPPGCGKTLMARALAGEAGAAFYSIAGSDFVEVYVGVGAARVRDLFKEARRDAPAIIFIDEIDAIGRRRAPGGGGNSEHEQALNQILAEMDGFSKLENVIVVGATNRPDVLDPALLRPGRFDRSIGLEHPGEEARLRIVELHARSRNLAADVDLAAIARAAVGLTGADLANVVNEAALLAGRAGHQQIAQEHLDAGLQRIVETPERQRRLSMRERSVGKRSGADARVTFDDVAGADDAVAELSEIKAYLSTPDRFVKLGARIPRGILLTGPPGCGKTLLAKAVAGETNAAFIATSGTEFVEVYVGKGAARVRDLFAEARNLAPAIIFIDEIDAVGGRRSAGSVDGRGEVEATLNQILVELDGFEARTGVIVIAATNRADMLDPALTRAGRFDRHVSVTMPDRAGREAILRRHVDGTPMAGGVDLAGVARITHGFSGADLANVVNEAALLAARADVEAVTLAFVEEAIERVMMGISSRRHILSDEERRLVAYHEAGHAIVSHALPALSVPHKITIVPRGEAAGYVWGIEPEERVVLSRSVLVHQLAMMLGGRAAEQLAIGDLAAGAAEDLSRANALARRMVCEYGMGERLGAQAFDTRGDGLPGYSEGEMQAIGADVRSLIDHALGLAHDALAARRGALDRVAAALLQHETLTAEQLDRLITPPPISLANEQ